MMYDSLQISNHTHLPSFPPVTLQSHRCLQICPCPPAAVVTIIIAPMKYLQAIWHFLRQIPQTLKNRLLRPSPQGHPATGISSQPSTHSNVPPPQALRRKKRKTFRSFIREDSRSSRRKQKGLPGARLKTGKASHHSHPKRSKFELSASSMDDHSKDLFTNELQPECSAFFEDNNGLQISAIASIASIRRQEEQQNRLDDSDEELLRLLYETQSNPPLEVVESRGKRESSRRDYGRTWWEAEIDNCRKEFLRSMDPSAGAVDFGERHLKIITLLDLNQDYPKVYHMPLSLHYA